MNDLSFPLKIAVQGKGVETFNKSSYKAAGGQGTVLVKNDTAYKIYHDPRSMIPLKKVQELSVLSKYDNILCPENILLDLRRSVPIGFTMPYRDNTEYIKRLFNKNYQTDNSITPDMIAALVKIMQATLADIHKENILVVDFNEMNFLTTMGVYSEIFFIDVDSYQTPTYKASALMESVRDRVSPIGHFNEGTDWFSFAIVAFQFYMGYHPYQKGRISGFKPADWPKRMDQNISIFHPDVDLSDNWKNFSVIPKPHFEWFKKVFHEKYRGIPPLPDGTALITLTKTVHIKGTDRFDVQLFNDFKEPIVGVYFFDGHTYTVTNKAVYSYTRLVESLNKKGYKISLAPVEGDTEPVVAYKSENQLIFNIRGQEVVLSARQAMSYNGRIYSIHNGRMTESFFKKIGQKVHLLSNPKIANIFEPATRLYPGVAVQDILGRCWLMIPYEPGKYANMAIPELDGSRIIDARHERGICIIISEKEGVYNRAVLCFNSKYDSYTLREEDNIAYDGVNFTVLGNGICIHIPNDDHIEIFSSNSKIKTIDAPPFTTDMRLVNNSTKVFFVNKTRLYSVGLR